MTKTGLTVVVVVTAIALLSVASYAGVEEKLSILTAGSDTNPQLTIDVPTSKTIRIVNNTGFPIYYLYVSPSASTEWGDDLLSIIETISNGEQYDTGIVADSTRYDIKCVDSEGYSFYKWDVDVSKSNIVEFTILDMDISEHASRETVKISNNTGYPIYHIYVSPTTDTEWEPFALSPFFEQGLSLGLPIDGCPVAILPSDTPNRRLSRVRRSVQTRFLHRDARA